MPIDIDVNSIQNPKVRAFYALTGQQRRILWDFYAGLDEDQYDFRMVDWPNRKADTPRESLAHLIYVQQVYRRAVETGKLDFDAIDSQRCLRLNKTDLLAAWERVDREMFDYLTSPTFDSECQVEAPWGKMNAVDLLFFLRDHDILHIGWNLAIMDHLNIPRYPSLVQYWG